MPHPNDQSRIRLRRSVYVMMVCAATGVMLGRILAVDAVDRRAIQEARIDRLLAEKRQAFERAGLAETEQARRMAAEEQRIREAVSLARPFLSANDRSRLAAVRALV
ncbi:MAG: hypothetical protein ACOC46_02365, partial [Pirellulales bacterium]